VHGRCGRRRRRRRHGVVSRMQMCRRPSLALARGVCIHTVCGSQSKMAACHRLSSEAGFDACVSQVLRKLSEEEEEEEQWRHSPHGRCERETHGVVQAAGIPDEFGYCTCAPLAEEHAKQCVCVRARVASALRDGQHASSRVSRVCGDRVRRRARPSHREPGSAISREAQAQPGSDAGGRYTRPRPRS
jgi:hypothetical protein